MSGFSNPIIGGMEVLIRSAMRSANYVAGIAGWRLSKDGDAELNDVVVRGTVDVVGSDGSEVTITAQPGGGALIELTPPSLLDPTIDVSPAFIQAFSDENVSPSAHVAMASPLLSKGTDIAYPATFQLLSSALDGSIAPAIALGNAGSQATTVTIDGNDVITAFNSIGTNTSSGAIGATETAVISFPSKTYKANQSYRVTVSGVGTVSVANNRPNFRLRKTNTAGQQVAGIGITLGAAGVSDGICWTGVFAVGASDVTASLVLTAQGSAGFNVTVVATAIPYTSEIDKIGVGSRVNGWAPILT